MNLRSAILFSAVISIIASCTKIENTDIGAGLIPPVDNIHTFETELNTTTGNLLDTASVFPIRTDNLVLGRINNDPLFGRTTAILNLEIKPEYFPYRFQGIYDSLTLDSAVLVLSYKGSWGDTTKPQTLNVYELSDSLKMDTVYNTKVRVNHKSTVLGSAVVDVRYLRGYSGADTLKPYGEVVKKDQVRIRLNNTPVLDSLFKDTAILTDNAKFRNLIKGFAIVPDTSLVSTSNSLMVVNVADSNTKIAFYYKYRLAGATQKETGVSYFRFQPLAGTLTSGFANTIIRNPVGAEYVKYLGGSAQDSLIYLQTRPDAPYARIKIPGLDTFSNCIVHRAELVIEQVPNTATGTMDDYFTPPALFLTAYSTDSTRKFMIPGGDLNFSVSGVANLQEFGAYPYRRSNRATYSFNLSRYVQALVTRKNRNYDFVLSAPFDDFVYAAENVNTLIPIAGAGSLNPLALGRIRVGGGNHSQYRMRLRIIYTRI